MKRFFRAIGDLARRFFGKGLRLDKNGNPILTKKQRAERDEMMRREGDHDYYKRQPKSQGGQKEDW